MPKTLVKKYAWIVRARRESGEDATQYNAAHGSPVTAEHVRQAPSVKEWLAGDRLVSIAPAYETPQLTRIREYFEDDGSPIKCARCDSSDIAENILGVVDVYQGTGPTCESEHRCNKCGEVVGYWAYGLWDPNFRESFISENQ